MTILVAESQRKIRGLVIFEYRRWNNTIYAYTLYVAKGFQGRGTGSKLLSEILERAKALKVRKIFLDTQKEGNGKVIEFFKKNGFKEAGIIKDYYHTLKCKDALILGLDLNRKS